MNNQTSQTLIVNVGTPPTTEEATLETAKLEVHFHNFRNLSSTNDVSVKSPKFTCFGRQWKLQLYPGGDCQSDSGKSAVYLHYYSNGGVEIDYILTVKNGGGRQIALHHEDNERFDFKDYDGTCDFSKRSRLIDALVDGTLIIEVSMTLIEKWGDTSVPPFVPKNPIVQNILMKFMDEETADVSFEVGSAGEKGRGECKRAKTAPTLFYAHHLILQNGAPDLANLCKSAEKSSPVRIADVSPDIFHHLMYYAYGGIITKEELAVHAKEIIDAADKYGVVNLKLEAEACYASSITLTAENMLDNLLYADSKNCALLREVVMDFIVENGKDILGKVSFNDVPGSMMTDLLTAMTREKKAADRSNDNGANDYETMRVSNLRKKLHEKGLAIDGSRETMIALLKESS